MIGKSGEPLHPTLIKRTEHDGEDEDEDEDDDRVSQIYFKQVMP